MRKSIPYIKVANDTLITHAASSYPSSMTVIAYVLNYLNYVLR